jgi:hypothetical protein
MAHARKGWPEFLIVGAPRCGTTALYHYLKQHPQVFMPGVKEVHFFGSDLDFRLDNYRLDAEGYQALFSGAESGQCRGEASVWYLYSESAAEEIAVRRPDTRIIVMLRNPVDVMYSLHSQFVYEGNEDIRDFAKALEAEESRRRGERIPPSAYLAQGLLYRRVVGFADQLQRFLKAFGRERVQVVIYDDFKDDTAGAFREVVRFLGVDDDFLPAFDIVNPNKQIRSRYLQRLMLNPPALTRRLSRLLRIPRSWRKLIYDRILGLNTRFIRRKNMQPELRARLQEEVREEVGRLGELLKRDLGFWLTGS